MPKEFSKKDAKAWARENFKGLEAPVFPSFTPDLADLDEDGIRYDVNHIIANGMKSILIAPEGTGMTMEEIRRFTKIVNEEVNGRIHVSISAVLNTVEDNIASVLEMTSFSKEYQKEKLEQLRAAVSADSVSLLDEQRQLTASPFWMNKGSCFPPPIH